MIDAGLGTVLLAEAEYVAAVSRLRTGYVCILQLFLLCSPLLTTSTAVCPRCRWRPRSVDIVRSMYRHRSPRIEQEVRSQDLPHLQICLEAGVRGTSMVQEFTITYRFDIFTNSNPHSPCSTPNWSRMKPSYLSQSSRTPPTTLVCVFSSLCWYSVLDILRVRATLYARVVRNRSNVYDDSLRAPRKPGHTLLDAAPWHTKLPIRPSRGRSIQTAT